MGLLESVHARNVRLSAWFEAHPGAYFLTLVCTAVLVFLGLALVTGGQLVGALVRGLAFGLVFATVTLLTRRCLR